MKKCILVLSTLSILSACNNGGGGSSKPALSQEEQLKQSASVTDYSTKILPNAFSIIKSNLSYEDQKEMYGIGCKTEGYSSGSLLEIDHQLKPGMVFKKTDGWQQVNEKGSLTTTELKMILVENLKLQYENNIISTDGLAPFNSLDEVFTKKPNFIYEKQYVLNDNSGYSSSENALEMNFTPAAKQYYDQYMSDMKNNKKFIACYVDYSRKDNVYESTTDKISYSLNGQLRNAYLVKSKNVSKNIICDQYTFKDNSPSLGKADFSVNMGPGVEERIEVKSNEVVTDGLYSCGGSLIYEASKLTLNETGKILSSHVSKILEAPLR